jgi:hypothetical protein
MYSQTQSSFHGYMCHDEERLNKLHAIDVISICIQLMTVIQDRTEREALLGLRGDDAVSILNLIQAVRTNFLPLHCRKTIHVSDFGLFSSRNFPQGSTC